MQTIEIEVFDKVDRKIGRFINAGIFDNAFKPEHRILIDFH